MDPTYFDDTEPGDIETPDDGPAPDITDAAQVQALSRCDWHLRRIARLTRERDTLDAVYRAEMDRLQLRHENRRRILTDAIEWHEAPLKSYAAMRRDLDGTKTLELPHGTIRSRTATRPTVHIHDKGAVVEWAKDVLPDVVYFEPKVSKSSLAAWVQQSGEIPPGVTVAPPTTTYHVSAEGGDV
jgi:phage host-nuclease inhibitor protein Gam